MVRRIAAIAVTALVLAAVTWLVWTSSPSVPLTLARQEAIARAASGASVGGTPAWTRVESKLVTYGELGPLLLTPGLGLRDPTDPHALVWMVAYRGRLPAIESATYQCEWVIRAFPADHRLLESWEASLCGQGQWGWQFNLMPDRSWWRMDSLRGG